MIKAGPKNPEGKHFVCTSCRRPVCLRCIHTASLQLGSDPQEEFPLVCEACGGVTGSCSTVFQGRNLGDPRHDGGCGWGAMSLAACGSEKLEVGFQTLDRVCNLGLETLVVQSRHALQPNKSADPPNLNHCTVKPGMLSSECQENSAGSELYLHVRKPEDNPEALPLCYPRV